MKHIIHPKLGYIKRAGENSNPRALRLEVQGLADSTSDGSFAFKEHAEHYRVSPRSFAGVILRISAEQERANLDQLEEHSVTLTLAEAEALIAHLETEVKFTRQLTEEIERL